MVELNFSVGDQVRLRLSDEEVDGTILESSDSSIVLLKLKSGYNIGIKKENILAGRALKKFQETESEKGKIESNPNLPKIGLIVTGGTIASKLDTKTGGVKHLADVNEFARFYPELFKVANVKVIEVPFMTSSEAMSSENWIKIAESAEKMLNDNDIRGVIVTHGTDTLGYTGAALSFFLKNLNKPLVLTYSQRSIDRASSDANLNLQCAAKMALSDCAEVMLVGHASMNDDYCFALRGSKVRKMHSSRRDAFKPVNASPIAKVWSDKIEFISQYKRRNDNSKVELDIDYTDKIALVKFYPGQTADILDFYALKYKGVVIEGSGLGHLPPSEAGHNWIPTLKKHIKNGFVVCVTTQCLYGRVDPFVYSNGRELVEAGVIFLEDMLSETALVKLGWVLGHYGWKKNVKEKMLENVAGEISDRLEVSE
jgi:glutamyl-tRNA(Gln) amidotransferase subunit D